MMQPADDQAETQCEKPDAAYAPAELVETVNLYPSGTSGDREYGRRLSNSEFSESNESNGSDTLVGSPLKSTLSLSQSSDGSAEDPSSPADVDPLPIADLSISPDPYGCNRRPQQYNGCPRTPLPSALAATTVGIPRPIVEKPKYLWAEYDRWKAAHETSPRSGRRPPL